MPHFWNLPYSSRFHWKRDPRDKYSWPHLEAPARNPFRDDREGHRSYRENDGCSWVHTWSSPAHIAECVDKLLPRCSVLVSRTRLPACALHLKLARPKVRPQLEFR